VGNIKKWSISITLTIVIFAVLFKVFEVQNNPGRVADLEILKAEINKKFKDPELVAAEIKEAVIF